VEMKEEDNNKCSEREKDEEAMKQEDDEKTI
jgi:hypothetical protein